VFVDAIAEAPADGRPLLAMEVTDDLLSRTGKL
jgi:hypothetical protein